MSIWFGSIQHSQKSKRAGEFFEFSSHASQSSESLKHGRKSLFPVIALSQPALKNCELCKWACVKWLIDLGANVFHR